MGCSASKTSAAAAAIVDAPSDAAEIAGDAAAELSATLTSGERAMQNAALAANYVKDTAGGAVKALQMIVMEQPVHLERIPFLGPLMGSVSDCYRLWRQANYNARHLEFLMRQTRTLVEIVVRCVRAEAARIETSPGATTGDQAARMKGAQDLILGVLRARGATSEDDLLREREAVVARTSGMDLVMKQDVKAGAVMAMEEVKLQMGRLTGIKSIGEVGGLDTGTMRELAELDVDCRGAPMAYACQTAFRATVLVLKTSIIQLNYGRTRFYGFAEDSRLNLDSVRSLMQEAIASITALLAVDTVETTRETHKVLTKAHTSVDMTEQMVRDLHSHIVGGPQPAAPPPTAPHPVTPTPSAPPLHDGMALAIRMCDVAAQFLRLHDHIHKTEADFKKKREAFAEARRSLRRLERVTSKHSVGGVRDAISELSRSESVKMGAERRFMRDKVKVSSMSVKRVAKRLGALKQQGVTARKLRHDRIYGVSASTNSVSWFFGADGTTPGRSATPPACGGAGGAGGAKSATPPLACGGATSPAWGCATAPAWGGTTSPAWGGAASPACGNSGGGVAHELGDLHDDSVSCGGTDIASTPRRRRGTDSLLFHGLELSGEAERILLQHGVSVSSHELVMPDSTADALTQSARTSRHLVRLRNAAERHLATAGHRAAPTPLL